MKRLIRPAALLFLPALLFTLLAQRAEAQEEAQKPGSKFYGNAAALFVNNYYFRGAYLYPENVPAFQPFVTLGYWIFDLNVWSSIPLRRRAELKDSRDEIDLTLTATVEVDERLALSLGLVTYLLTTSDPFWHTEEIFVSPTYRFTDNFSLKLSVYGDVNQYKGAYLSLSPVYSRRVAKRLTLTAAAILGCQMYRGTAFQFVEAALRADLDVDIWAGLRWTLGGLINANAAQRALRYFLQTGFIYEW